MGLLFLYQGSTYTLKYVGSGPEQVIDDMAKLRVLLARTEPNYIILPDKTVLKIVNGELFLRDLNGQVVILGDQSPLERLTVPEYYAHLGQGQTSFLYEPCYMAMAA